MLYRAICPKMEYRRPGNLALVEYRSHPMTKTVKVAVFRNETDRVFRAANVHYHACVNAFELENWQGIARRALESVQGLTCARASAYDLEQFNQAVAALQSRLAASVERVETLKASEAAA